MLGLLPAIVSSPEVVSAPEQPSLVRLLPIALIGGIFEGLSLRGFLDNAQNSIFFGLREIYVSIVVRNVDDDIERVRHVSTVRQSLADIRIRARAGGASKPTFNFSFTVRSGTTRA